MFPFWRDVVAPLITACEARRIVEIGALRGDNTRLMLEDLGPDAELHVIDPVPSFDPTEHEEQFPGRYIFHRDLSLNVLGELPPMDVALIDGDHNYYTVRNELRLLSEVARAADAPMPVMVLHDVGWPYGRRDLYYDPSNIPAEHRHKWRRSGMRPGRRRLMPFGGGLNAELANAVQEGGARNGVMTAVDDFVADHDRPLKLIVLPIYFGLAIVVEEKQLDHRPALADHLGHLESPAGKDMLLGLAEQIRLDAALFEQSVMRQRDTRIANLTSRLLDTVKSAILNDHHLEDEVRLRHLLDTTSRGAAPNPDAVRDPIRGATDLFRRVQRAHHTGEHLADPDTDESSDIAHQGYASSGRVGLDHLHECLDAGWSDGLRGDLAVCGVGAAGAAVLMASWIHTHDHEPLGGTQRLWLAGSFRESDGSVDLNRARETLHRFGVLDERVHLLQGDPRSTLPDIESDDLALVHIGPSPAAHVRAALELLHPRLVEGGAVVIEDTSLPGVAEAVDSYLSAHAPAVTPERVGRAIVAWRKDDDGGVHADTTVSPAAATSHAPLAPSAGKDALDLSVVVVVHDMRRQAARTLHALSSQYQQDLDDVDYEVLVVENGSSADQRLGEDLVRSFGREFRYLDLGDDATASPAAAMNRGIATSRGRVLALMVDGAHILTPRVLRHGLTGADAYAPAVVATQPWYVGPGQQGEAMRYGYDTAAEDTLFEQIRWPEDGYRLFEIGHFVGDRDWFDGVWESNCLFVPRALLEQVGGFDEGFAMPGGGYTNLDLFERLSSSPDFHVVSILGEGSFHQVHGGTTTNIPDPEERRERVRSYNDHYQDLRGRPFRGPEKPIHYVGGFHTDAALRSRSRRMTATSFEVDPRREGADGRAGDSPLPVADDLKDAFINAYYQSLAWKRTEWLGKPVPNAATDLVAYQELLADVRPDWVLLTGVRKGDGRGLFLASICELLDHGRVVTVGANAGPPHPRIVHVDGSPNKEDTAEKVRSVVGDARTLVLLGSRAPRHRTRQEFELYAPLVPVGSYVVIEHTTLNGFPIDATFGPGPHEALRRIMNLHGEFLADPEREKHTLTFNAGGFLRRIS